MPRRSRYSAALRARARELGVRVPIYEMGAATAEVNIPGDVELAAREIVDRLEEVEGEESRTDPFETGEFEMESEPATGSGRSKDDPRVISLSI
ncbi:MAG TPA: hypothetical protein VIH92_14820 [Solirubrobacteraceae bacterium]